MKLKLKLKNKNRSKSRKIDYINYVYNKAITYWKKAARERRKRIAGFSAFKNFVETQTPWKHAFFVCAKIVFHTLENLIDQGLELCSKK